VEFVVENAEGAVNIPLGWTCVLRDAQAD